MKKQLVSLILTLVLLALSIQPALAAEPYLEAVSRRNPCWVLIINERVQNREFAKLMEDGTNVVPEDYLIQLYCQQTSGPAVYIFVQNERYLRTPVYDRSGKYHYSFPAKSLGEGMVYGIGYVSIFSQAGQDNYRFQVIK